MKVPMSWLKDFVDIDVTPRDFADALTMSGSMVEGVEQQGENIINVVTGKILKIEKHPDADKLVVCQVDIGEGVVQIVTGAQNVFEGAVVPVAKDGSTLPAMKIKKGKLRGVESCGMLCSEEELEIAEEPADGIMILPENTGIGKDIREVLGLNEVIVDFEITSNRPDCLSVMGLARETAVTFGKPFTKKNPVVKGCDGAASSEVKINVLDKELCPRYTARVVKNVKIEPSPDWMKRRLENSGVRSINNIVDITNYVMLEYGQPMHAFDLRTLGGSEINVRKAKEGECITTLDGEEHILDGDTLVIADASRPIAVAGVMGGENTEIQNDTSSILFESANFSGGSVRMTAKKLGLRTESSSRFEKGLDPNNTIGAINRACELVELLGAGDVSEVVIDVIGSMPQPKTLDFSPEKINSFLGTDIPADFMVKTLEALEFNVEGNKLTAPSFRADIECAADVAEEIARIYGYNNIPITLLKGTTTVGGRNRSQQAEAKIKNLFISLGYYEIITNSFTGPKMYEKLMIDRDDAVVISNPIGEDQSLMRTNTIDSMLNVISTNYNYRNSEAAFFEIGTKYIAGSDGLAEEKKVITAGIYGKDTDYYRIKGDIQQLFEDFGIGFFDIRPESSISFMHPGQTAVISLKNRDFATIGKIHPSVLKNYEIGTDVYIAEIDFETIVSLWNEDKKYKHLPKYPAITRDIALVVKDEVTVRDIENIFRGVKSNIIESYSLFDVYKGKQVEEGHKSIAYSITFRTADKTLTDEEVNPVLDKIVSALETRLDAKLRVS